MDIGSTGIRIFGRARTPSARAAVSPSSIEIWRSSRGHQIAIVFVYDDGHRSLKDAPRVSSARIDELLEERGLHFVKIARPDSVDDGASAS